MNCFFGMHHDGRIDRRVDFRNSALPVLTGRQISGILHCRRWQMPGFPKICITGFSQNWAIWGFSIAEFSQNEVSRETTLPIHVPIFAVWDKSENLHYKSTMPLFWNQQFCVKSTDFASGNTEDRNAFFLNVPGLSTPTMLFDWKYPICQHR